MACMQVYVTTTMKFLIDDIYLVISIKPGPFLTFVSVSGSRRVGLYANQVT